MICRLKTNCVDLFVIFIQCQELKLEMGKGKTFKNWDIDVSSVSGRCVHVSTRWIRRYKKSQKHSRRNGNAWGHFSRCQKEDFMHSMYYNTALHYCLITIPGCILWPNDRLSLSKLTPMLILLGSNVKIFTRGARTFSTWPFCKLPCHLLCFVQVSA